MFCSLFWRNEVVERWCFQDGKLRRELEAFILTELSLIKDFVFDDLLLLFFWPFIIDVCWLCDLLCINAAMIQQCGQDSSAISSIGVTDYEP